MKVVVVGLGSMGKRRIRLIRKKYDSFEIIGVDTNEERRKYCEDAWDIPTYNNIMETIMATGADCAFICTPPLSHCDIISQCLNSGLHVFSELNLVADGYEANIELSKRNNLVLFISSTFLYRDEIMQIKKLTQEAKGMLNYSYHVGQYLPDWHPWENYQDFFVGNKRSNACRELFAIELPWLSDVFGDITNIQVLKSKISDLDIDYNDNYLTLVEHASGYRGALIIDVISRKAVRNLEIFGERLYLHWDGSPNGLYIYDYMTKKDVNIQLYQEIDQLDNYSNFVVENAYSNEISAFFDAVLEGQSPVYGFENDKQILKIIDGIEV